MADKNNYSIKVLDMTSLFTKELLLYSLFDIKFKRPVKLIFWVYLLLLLAIWGLPIAYILFIKLRAFNVYTGFLVIGPPIGLAMIMSKPIWGGKSFFDFAKTQIIYLSSHKYFCDTKPAKRDESFKTDSIFTVSRRADIKLLESMED